MVKFSVGSVLSRNKSGNYEFGEADSKELPTKTAAVQVNPQKRKSFVKNNFR